MRIKYIPGETVQEASEIDDTEEFITITKALQFFAGRTLAARGQAFELTPAEEAERLGIESTFDTLVLYMQAGMARLNDGYGPTELNPRHTNYVLDSLDALVAETPDTLERHEAAFAQYIPAARYMLNHVEEDPIFRQELVVASIAA